jgi:hypothetical protein
MVVTSALLQFYYTSNDYRWFMFYLVIAGLFVSFAVKDRANETNNPAMTR